MTSPLRRRSPFTYISLDPEEDDVKYVDRLPVAEILKGPFVCYAYRFQDKFIYLFGEEHIQPICPYPNVTIADFVYRWLQQQQIQIDFFLETSSYLTTSTLNMYRKSDLPIDNLRYLVNSELGRSNSKFFGINRVHSVDIRNDFVDPTLRKLSNYLPNFESFWTLNDLKRALKEIDDDNKLELLVSDFELYIDRYDPVVSSKLRKQLDKVYLNYGEYAVSLLSKERRGIVYKELSYLISKKNLSRKQKKELKHLIYVLYDMFVHLTDMYALARIMKPYTKNIIVYTGAAHTERYATFFDDMEAALIGEAHDIKENGCLDIHEIPQPFFTNIGEEI
jgi:hypothetical protein